MEDQFKSVEQTAEQKSSYTSNTQNHMGNEMNKTYDDFDLKRSGISLLSKVIPILLYILFKIVTDQHLSLFVFTVILLAVDFWITKNILGPKLVGLKWYSQTDENSYQKWYFVAASPNRIISNLNSYSFWLPQILAISFWIIIVILNIVTLSFFWVALAVFAAFLLVLNFAFFLQCKGDHQKKVRFLAKKLGFNLYQDQQSLNPTNQ